MKRNIFICVRIICGIALAVSALLFFASKWISECLDVSFAQILNTIHDPLEGANLGAMIRSPEARQQIIYLFLFLLSVELISLSWINLRVGEYIATSKQTTTIYEDYYVPTTLDLISSNETTPQNLIFMNTCGFSHFYSLPLFLDAY